MVSIAVHDALNGIKHEYARYASSANDRRASPVAAAAQAAHDVLVALLPAQQASLDAKLALDRDARRRLGRALRREAADRTGASRPRRLRRRRFLRLDVPSGVGARPPIHTSPRAGLGRRTLRMTSLSQFSRLRL
jgi:hypothetical protein